MKIISKLSLLAIAVSLASCNEKVSPELQGGNSSDPSTEGPTVVPSEYYFALENTSHLMLNYKLHKTGAGNANTKCEVRRNTPLSNDAYRGSPAVHDITCYMEAEELSLNAGGMSWKVSASPNTCEFIGYAPYSYYNRQPGDSSATYTEFLCGNTDTTSGHMQTAALANGVNPSYAGGGTVVCGQILIDQTNPHIPVANRLPFTVENDEEFCRFNYKDMNEENCDVGTITVNTFTASYSVESTLTSVARSSRIIRCGGKRNNCVQGAIRLEPTLDNTSKGTVITQTTWDAAYEKEYKFPAPLDDRRQNLMYVNFRRDLASAMVDYGSSVFPYTPTYKASWSDPIFGKVIEPRLIDYYSQNMALDGTRLINLDSTLVGSYWNTVSTATNQYIARPHAADPFFGTHSNVNPYYTYYCLDTAMDIKARIRVMVRDWDRLMPATSDVELISDIHKGSNSRQDIPDEWEVPGDPDIINRFNDWYDWEDIISMERDGLSSPVIYRPVPSGVYSQGYFNPNWFPNEDLSQEEAQ
ncbi:hypothetical protein [Peredibacter starrii]|uniref:Lipoprotein n=1 Tax=Peredibacter starrii TaxID=28202 RepID=A0AAX4HJG4_9BACT|nr:hypothetical protein [Peredibacter starrii]WPU63174.1 hypothetical protein SOO65_10805 [Peredibacter starrii]